MTDAQAKKKIAQLNKEFVKNANDQQPDKLVDNFYAKDAVLMPGGQAANIKGRKAIRPFWEDMIFKEGATKVTLKTDVIHASGDMAYEIGRFGYTAKDKRVTGKYVVVYRTQKGHAVSSLQAAVDMFAMNGPEGA